MSYNIANSGSYLRTSRNFPGDAQALSVELSKSYVDIASAVNERTIGIFATVQTVTGNSWFLGGVSPIPNNQRQQSIRQVFKFTATGSIPHGINFASVALVAPTSYGSFTDGTNWYGAIFASNVAIAGQVSFYVTPTNVVVIAGAGAPTITSGYIVVEFVATV